MADCADVSQFWRTPSGILRMRAVAVTVGLNRPADAAGSRERRGAARVVLGVCDLDADSVLRDPQGMYRPRPAYNGAATPDRDGIRARWADVYQLRMESRTRRGLR